MAGNLYMAHRCGFTKNVLSNTLAMAGFDVAAKVRPQQYDLWALGIKASVPNIERLKQLCAIYFP